MRRCFTLLILLLGLVCLSFLPVYSAPLPLPPYRAMPTAGSTRSSVYEIFDPTGVFSPTGTSAYGNLGPTGSSTPQGSTVPLSIPVKEHTLTNGMKVLIVERHDYPVFSAYIQFNVGNVNEYPGITGGAHFLEHMMFKGTKLMGTWNYQEEIPILKKIDKLGEALLAEERKGINGYSQVNKTKVSEIKKQIKALQAEQKKKYIISEELWGHYLQNGGSGLNASTWEDITNYYVSLPSNRFELWAFLESDRISNPVFREYYSERDVVYEERRLRTDTQPDGSLYEALSSLIFQSSPYHVPVVGWPSDLTHMKKADIEDFFKTYYAPNNAVAVVVGDVKEEEVIKLMKKYFEPIPSQPIPNRILPKEEVQKGEKRVEVEFDANPIVFIGYQAPIIGTKDFYAMQILSQVLGYGRTSRLYKALIEETQVAYDFEAQLDIRKFATAFIVYITPKAPKTTEDAEKVLYHEIERLKTEPVSNWELEKVRNHLESEFVKKLESNNGLAFRLGFSQGFTGSWKNIDEREKLKAVTPEDIMRVAKSYLVKSRRSVATLVSSGGKNEN